MRLDGRNGFLFFQDAGNRLYFFPQAGEIRPGLQNGKLGAQYQNIEAFGFFVLVNEFGRQAGKVLSQLVEIVTTQFLPRLRLGIYLHREPKRENDECGN